ISSASPRSTHWGPLRSAHHRTAGLIYGRNTTCTVVSHSSQLVIPSSGSTFTRWITSPRRCIVLTRDTTNHPIWCHFYADRGV
ncbi:hypothetical protein EDD15DRAFT_1307620, partial [Pisolithus albus]